MTRQEAEEIIKKLIGWDNVEIKEDDWGNIYIEATEPSTGQRMIYNITNGYFE